MNSKIQARKIKRFNERKETVKTAMNNIVDIEILMAMTPDELKALTKSIGKIKGLKKTYNAIYNPVIISTESVSDSSDVETETSEPEEEKKETEEEKESVIDEITAPTIQQEEDEEEEETDVKALDEYYQQENLMFNNYQQEINRMKLSEQIILNSLPVNIIKEEPINIITESVEPVEVESVIVENLTPAIEEYDADILAKIIKKYNPNSLKVKEFFFKDERKFIDLLTNEFTDVKTIRYYKKQIDMSEFDIYETQKPAPEIQLKIFKTERPEYTINADNVDEFITKNNIYINRKQTKKKDKVELILLNDILLKIKSNEDITEKERILIEKKYCKDEFKRDQFSYYYNENFINREIQFLTNLNKNDTMDIFKIYAGHGFKNRVEET